MENHKAVHIGGRMKVCPSEILYLKADENYTRLFLKGGKSLHVATTLGELEKRFLKLGFFRTHRSIVINAEFMIKLNFPYVEISNAGKLPVSRRRFLNIKSAMLDSGIDATLLN